MKCFVPAVVQRCAMHVKKPVMAGGSLGKAVQPAKLLHSILKGGCKWARSGT